MTMVEAIRLARMNSFRGRIHCWPMRCLNSFIYFGKYGIMYYCHEDRKKFHKLEFDYSLFLDDTWEYESKEVSDIKEYELHSTKQKISDIDATKPNPLIQDSIAYLLKENAIRIATHHRVHCNNPCDISLNLLLDLILSANINISEEEKRYFY